MRLIKKSMRPVCMLCILILTVFTTAVTLTACDRSSAKNTSPATSSNVAQTTAAPTQTPAPKPTKDTLNMKVPILYYHAVNDTTFGLEQMFVRVSEFEQQMKYMKDNGYQSISFSDLDNIGEYEKPFLITFDDGYMDNYTNMYPILKKYGFKATVFMVWDYIDKGSFLTKEQILEMRDAVDFESHTVSHEYLSQLSSDQIEVQLRDSKTKLEGLIGKPVTVIAYPYGDYDQRVIDTATKYYKYGALMGGGLFFYNKADFMRINRVYIPRGLDIETFKNKLEGL